MIQNEKKLKRIQTEEKISAEYPSLGEKKSYRFLPIGIILAIAVLLSLYQLNTESLWIDEMLSISDAKIFFSQPEYARPFYYLLLRIWMFLGNGDAWLRGLSVLFGLGTVFCTYELGRRLLGKHIGQLAALLMAISPLFINHMQEVRMYSLISFLSVLGTLGLSQVLMGSGYGWLVLWVVARIALLLTNANNVLILLPDFLLIVWTFRQQRRQLFRMALAYAVICFSFLPTFYLLVFGGVASSYLNVQVAGYSNPGMLQIGGMITQLTAYYPLSFLLHKNDLSFSRAGLSDSSLLSAFFSVQSLTLIFYGVVTLLLLGLLLISVIAASKERYAKQYFWILAWGVLPAIAMLVVSYLQNSIWFPRYLMFVAPYFLLMLATGFWAIWDRRRNLAIAVAVIYLLATFGSLKDYYTTFYRNDWKGLAQVIYENEQPGDKIFYYSIPRLYEESFPRYYQGDTPLHLITLPQGTQSLSEQPGVIERSLSQEPVDSRLWVVCWVFCKDSAGIEQIFQTALGPGFTIPIEQEFTSAEESVRLKVYLATKATATSSSPE